MTRKRKPNGGVTPRYLRELQPGDFAQVGANGGFWQVAFALGPEVYLVPRDGSKEHVVLPGDTELHSWRRREHPEPAWYDGITDEVDPVKR